MFPVPDRLLGNPITGLVHNTDVIMYTKDKYSKIFCVLTSSRPNWSSSCGNTKNLTGSVFGVHRLNHPPPLPISYLVPSAPIWLDGSK